MCENPLNMEALILHHLHISGMQHTRIEPYLLVVFLRSVVGLGMEVTAERLSKARGVAEELNS